MACMPCSWHRPTVVWRTCCHWMRWTSGTITHCYWSSVMLYETIEEYQLMMLRDIMSECKAFKKSNAFFCVTVPYNIFHHCNWLQVIPSWANSITFCRCLAKFWSLMVPSGWYADQKCSIVWSCVVSKIILYMIIYSFHWNNFPHDHNNLVHKPTHGYNSNYIAMIFTFLYS